jgi:hypothetical protein
MLRTSGCSRPLLAAATAFITAPASAHPLAWLRIGLAAVLLVQAWAVAGSALELYGSHAVVQWSVIAPLTRPDIPSVRWVEAALGPWGVSEAACVRGVFLAYVAGLGCLLVGWHTRLAALLAWLTHLALCTSAEGSTYGVDQFAHIGLFYCLVMPVGHALSADCRLGRVAGGPSSAARLGLRVLQLHLCLIYLTSGIEKARGEQWWNGEAIWRAVMCPDAGPFDFSWLASAPWLAMLACWGTLLVEVGYAFLIWPGATRRAWALATIGLHAGIAVTLDLWSFSAVMVVLTTSAFLACPEPVAEVSGAVTSPAAPAPS